MFESKVEIYTNASLLSYVTRKANKVVHFITYKEKWV